MGGWCSLFFSPAAYLQQRFFLFLLMSGISKATVSFDSRPQIKIAGVKQSFKMMDVGGKSIMGVDLGNDTIARLKSMPGGKYDIELMHKSGQELSEMNINVKGGSLSRLSTLSGGTVEGMRGREGQMTINRDFVSGFLAGGRDVAVPQDRSERLAGSLDQRLQTLDHINGRLASPKLDSSERRKLEKEREVVEKEIYRNLDKQDGVIPPKQRAQSHDPITPPKLGDDHGHPKQVGSPKSEHGIEIGVDEDDSPKLESPSSKQSPSIEIGVDKDDSPKLKSPSKHSPRIEIGVDKDDSPEQESPLSKQSPSIEIGVVKEDPSKVESSSPKSPSIEVGSKKDGLPKLDSSSPQVQDDGSGGVEHEQPKKQVPPPSLQTPKDWLDGSVKRDQPRRDSPPPLGKRGGVSPSSVPLDQPSKVESSSVPQSISPPPTLTPEQRLEKIKKADAHKLELNRLDWQISQEVNKLSGFAPFNNQFPTFRGLTGTIDDYAEALEQSLTTSNPERETHKIEAERLRKEIVSNGHSTEDNFDSHFAELHRFVQSKAKVMDELYGE